MPDATTDEELARRLQGGDEAALGEIMERYTGKLLRYGQRFLGADDDAIGDVVQDVFISAYQNIRSFEPARRFSPWVYRIAHNAFVDALRKRAKDPVAMDYWELDRILPHSGHEDAAAKEKEADEIRVLLEKYLDALPANYREIIALYYFENFSYQEISDILHIPIGTVGIRLSRAKSKLKTLFSKETL